MNLQSMSTMVGTFSSCDQMLLADASGWMALLHKMKKAGQRPVWFSLYDCGSGGEHTGCGDTVDWDAIPLKDVHGQGQLRYAFLRKEDRDRCWDVVRDCDRVRGSGKGFI